MMQFLSKALQHPELLQQLVAARQRISNGEAQSQLPGHYLPLAFLSDEQRYAKTAVRHNTIVTSHTTLD